VQLTRLRQLSVPTLKVPVNKNENFFLHRF
jgi:hypothetical protein